MVRRLVPMFLALAATVFAAAAPAAAQKHGGILKITHRDSPPSASIHEEATVSVVMPFAGIYNNLVVFDPKEKQNSLEHIVPELATAWKWNDDGTALTFTLQDGVKWHDGKPFSSADVKCTWDMLTGKTDAKLRKNPRKSWYFNLKEVTVNGPLEVTFHLGRRQPSFLALLASAYSPVYPCHVPAAQMRTKPIGTGPFKFAELKQNESIKLVRNPDYWKPGLPYLDGIQYTIIGNISTSILAFIANRFDMTFTGDVTMPLMKDINAQAPTAVCDMQPVNSQVNLLVNRDKPPFDNATVRRALVLALDRKAFVDIVQGAADIGGALLPPPAGIWGMPPDFLKTVAGYGPDIEKSREEGRKLMKSLGYGPDNPLTIKVATRNIAMYRDPAVLLIDQLKQVYIQGELEPLDTAVWYARMARKDYSVGLNVQGIGTDDPDVVFYETFSCGSERNYTNYCNPEMEKLFAEQSSMVDQIKRKALVWEIDKKLQEDGARPVIYHYRFATCHYPYVKGIKMAVNTTYNHWRFEDVWLDK